MSFANTLYNNVFKRSSSLILVSVVGAIFLDGAINMAADKIFNTVNRGKLWDHIKDNYNKEE